MRYDLTDIPAGYDRGRDHGPEVLNLWLDAVERRLPPEKVSMILDLGCGTGRFTQGLARRFDAEVVGLDPSSKMLDQARLKPHDPRVKYWQGEAEMIPLPSRSCDIVFMSMSYHHLNNVPRALAECSRVVRERGRVVVRTASRDRIADYPYVPYFPSSRAILDRMLPTVAGIEAAFLTAGFTRMSAEVIDQVIAPDWGSYAEKLATRSDSVIAQLAETELTEGLALVRANTELLDPRVVEPIDLLVFKLRAPHP